MDSIPSATIIEAVFPFEGKMSIDKRVEYLVLFTPHPSADGSSLQKGGKAESLLYSNIFSGGGDLSKKITTRCNAFIIPAS
jgi:hypothetical protein